MTKLIGTKPNQVPVNANLSRTAYIRPEDLPVSNAVRVELDGKVDKVEGKQLSTEDYTTSEKNKLAGIAAGAEVNTVTSVAGKTGAVTLSKSDVGLSNVDNTSDADKPVSSAQAAALAGKANVIHTHSVGQVTGLGTAATLDVVTSLTDTTAGRLMALGTWGFGGNAPKDNSFHADDMLPGQRRAWSDSITEADAVQKGLPALGGVPTTLRSWIVETAGSTASRIIQEATEIFGIGTTRGRTFIRVKHDSTWHPWQEIYTTGNFSPGAAAELDIATTAQAQSLTNDDVVITPQKLADAFSGANRRVTGDNRYQIFPGTDGTRRVVMNIKTTLSVGSTLAPGQAAIVNFDFPIAVKAGTIPGIVATTRNAGLVIGLNGSARWPGGDTIAARNITENNMGPGIISDIHIVVVGDI